MCVNVNKTTELVNEYLKSNQIHSDNVSWEIRNSPLGDRGVFATRDIHPGELIFTDCPIIIGPRVRKDSPEICVSCYKDENIKNCSKNCGLPVCSETCENSDSHIRECNLIKQWENGNGGSKTRRDMLKCLTPVRSLILNDKQKELVKALKSHIDPKHGFEVDILIKKLSLNISNEDACFMRLVCSILDANAFEVLVGDDSKQISLRGLYTLGCLVNHNCAPNTIHVFNDKQHMVVRAAVFIPKDGEIFHCYTRLIWGTLMRRHHLLATKHFCCTCERCCDPTEFGGFLNALKCPHCTGYVVPVNPLKSKSQWECIECNKVMLQSKVGFVNSVLGTRLHSFDDDVDADNMVGFLNGKLSVLVHGTNQIALELKYKLIWIFGYKKGYTWDELSEDYLQLKEQLCRDILNLLQILRTGMCKMRGLLLYELYCCLKEKQRRLMSEEMNNNTLMKNSEEAKEMVKLLSESADIFMYDVGAPQEIKNTWKINST